MKKLALPALLLALFAATLAPSSVAETGIRVKLELVEVNENFEGIGILSVEGAEGSKIRVWDGAHHRIIRDVVPAWHWETVVPLEGKDVLGNLLYVKLPGVVFSITDDDDDWIWE